MSSHFSANDRAQDIAKNRREAFLFALLLFFVTLVLVSYPTLIFAELSLFQINTFKGCGALLAISGVKNIVFILGRSPQSWESLGFENKAFLILIGSVVCAVLVAPTFMPSR